VRGDWYASTVSDSAQVERFLEDATMVERILLPLDGSPFGERALPYALRLASATGARLILLYGHSRLVSKKEPQFDVRAYAGRLRDGHAGVSVTGTTGLEIDAVTHDIYGGNVAEAIGEAIVEQRADLVVMSTHGHSGPGRWLYGSVADQVIRQSQVPIVLVSITCDHVWEDAAPLRIVVPLDGSAFAAEVLDPVGKLASPLKAELLLVGAAGPLEYGYADGVPFQRSGFDAALKETREYLEGIAARLRTEGHTVTVDAETGRAATVIDTIARRRHIDLIAMATHGRSGMARATLGSVTAELLHRSTVPLLLWRPTALRHATQPTAASASVS
jgi:nucleotide-binding universal stress UspA family protein